MENEIDLEALLELVNGSFGITCNANDFFQYACADAVTISPDDLKWVLPIIKKYGYIDGENACMAYIAKLKPIKPRLTEKFQAAYKEIEKLNPEVHSEY